VEIDEEVLAGNFSEDSEGDEDDTAEVKALKVTFICIYPRTQLR
jgi:hypothetical protein